VCYSVPFFSLLFLFSVPFPIFFFYQHSVRSGYDVLAPTSLKRKILLSCSFSFYHFPFELDLLLFLSHLGVGTITWNNYLADVTIEMTAFPSLTYFLSRLFASLCFRMST